jgi:apolipoprotein N-acyltransferase
MVGRAKMSVIICFEDVVPHLARHAATPEVDFLLNLTNDGWFGKSHQQWQHARSAAWRAIETRRPLVRCTNNGITCWIDEYGRFHGVKPPVHAPRVNIVTIPLREGPRAPTVYQRTGDWLPWGAVLACAVLIFLRCKNGSASGALPVK